MPLNDPDFLASIATPPRSPFVSLADGAHLTFLCSADITAVLVGLVDLAPAAHLRWAIDDDGEITFIATDMRYQRRGIATLLMVVATELSKFHGWPVPMHSAHRSAEGDGWARHIGGDLPEPSEPIRPYLEMVEAGGWR